MGIYLMFNVLQLLGRAFGSQHKGVLELGRRRVHAGNQPMRERAEIHHVLRNNRVSREPQVRQHHLAGMFKFLETIRVDRGQSATLIHNVQIKTI